MAKLLVQESNGAREFELVDLEVNIGRELDNSLRLADPSISRHHAVLKQTDQGYEIQDLGSSNGVLLNGNRVQTALLQDGDRITLGQLQLTYVDPRPVQSSENPLGTVRMSMDDMAKLQAGTTAEIPAPALIPLAPIPPPAPAPMAPPAPQAPAPWPPKITVQDNPAPEFLRSYLPSIPDDAQPLMLDGQVERGEFGARFLAHLLDGLIGSVALVGFLIMVSMLTLVTRGFGCLAFLLYPLVGIGYFVFMLWCMVTFRATLGKKIMKLRVVPEDNPAGNIDWGMALLRILGHIVSGMCLYLPYLLILGKERKGFQDMFSRSIVIKVDR